MIVLQINRMGLARISNLFLPACLNIDNIINPANSQNRYFRYQLEFVDIAGEDFQITGRNKRHNGTITANKHRAHY